jgi:hypothetical protein
MKTRFSVVYPTVAALLTDGAVLDIHAGGYPPRVVGMFAGSQIICQFECSEMSVDEVFSRLEELALR